MTSLYLSRGYSVPFLLSGIAQLISSIQPLNGLSQNFSLTLHEISSYNFSSPSRSFLKVTASSGWLGDESMALGIGWWQD